MLDFTTGPVLRQSLVETETYNQDPGSPLSYVITRAHLRRMKEGRLDSGMRLLVFSSAAGIGLCLAVNHHCSEDVRYLENKYEKSTYSSECRVNIACNQTSRNREPARGRQKSSNNSGDNEDNNEKQLPLIKTLTLCQTQC